MLGLKNLTMRYPTGLLFENINIELNKGERYGLIGANGAGKSTLLKIMAGELEASSGEVQIATGARLGVLGQDQFAFEEYSLEHAVLYGNKRLFDAVMEKEKIYAETIDYSDEINDRLSQLELLCAEEDPNYDWQSRCERILSNLNLKDPQALMSSLQNADKFKVLIAQVLFAKPDILLLDEPTNNLDLPAIAWLESELARHEGLIIVISHDRYFLNSVCTRMLDIDFKTLREFAGNYDDWYTQSTLLARQKEAKLAKNLKEKEELENFIRRFSANVAKARQASSRQKQLEKLDLEEIKTSSRRDPSILFRPNREIGNELLAIKNLSKSYGEKVVYRDLTLATKRDDKIALIGPSGAGKSTLLSMIAGLLKPDSGSAELGVTVELGYFEQDVASSITSDLRLYDYLMSEKHKDIDEIRKCLGRMLFSGADQEKAAKDLSGGEKHRLTLSKLMLERGNFLLFDEPDNHLDLEAIIALGEALYNFKGALICATHDRDLIRAFANRIWSLEPVEASGASPRFELIDFLGSYEEFLASRAA